MSAHTSHPLTHRQAPSRCGLLGEQQRHHRTGQDCGLVLSEDSRSLTEPATSCLEDSLMALAKPFHKTPRTPSSPVLELRPQGSIVCPAMGSGALPIRGQNHGQGTSPTHRDGVTSDIKKIYRAVPFYTNPEAACGRQPTAMLNEKSQGNEVRK